MYNETVQHITTIATSFLQSLMALQAKLTDVESQTQVLSLIGLLLELIGKRSQEVVLAVVNIWVQVSPHPSLAFSFQEKEDLGEPEQPFAAQETRVCPV